MLFRSQTRIRRNEQALRTRLAGSATHPLNVQGGGSAVVRIPAVRSEDAWIEMLVDRHGLIVQPGYFFDMEREAYLVISLLTAPEIFDEGLQLLRGAAEL